MAESEAMIGYGTTFEVRDGSGAWFKLGEVTNITPPSSEVADVDVTHLESPDRTDESIPGLRRYSVIPVALNWIPGNETDDYVEEWEASGEKRQCRIVYPNNFFHAFPGYSKGFAGDPIEVEGKLSGTLNVKVAGAKTRGTAT